MSQQPVLPVGAARAMDVDTPWEREYWARHFHIAEHELVRIVEAVEPDTEAVTRFIQEKAKTTFATPESRPAPSWESMRKR